MAIDYEETGVQRMMHDMIAGRKAADFAQKPIKTLGEVILLLRAQRRTNVVNFDFDENVNPGRLDSYRGYYEDLALGYGVDCGQVTVADLLLRFEDADGKPSSRNRGERNDKWH